MKFYRALTRAWNLVDSLTQGFVRFAHYTLG